MKNKVFSAYFLGNRAACRVFDTPSKSRTGKGLADFFQVFSQKV